MNAIEERLAELEHRYEEGLLTCSDFCDAVVEYLSQRLESEYSLPTALSARAVSRVVGDMNVMRSAMISGDCVLTVDNSAKTYNHTAKVPQYIALAEVWQAAGWIELAAAADGIQRWRPTDLRSND